MPEYESDIRGDTLRDDDSEELVRQATGHTHNKHDARIEELEIKEDMAEV